MDASRECPCGITYDDELRGVEGPFHFLVVMVQERADDAVTVAGHWRSGVWRAGERLQFTRKDGHALTVVVEAMDTTASDAAEQRGQRVLKLRGPEARSLQGRGCLRSTVI